MNGPERTGQLPAIVLWKKDAMSCTCVTRAPDNIEVRLVVAGVVVHHEFFSDADAASRFAIDKMHAYWAH